MSIFQLWDPLNWRPPYYLSSSYHTGWPHRPRPRISTPLLESKILLALRPDAPFLKDQQCIEMQKCSRKKLRFFFFVSTVSFLRWLRESSVAYTDLLLKVRLDTIQPEPYLRIPWDCVSQNHGRQLVVQVVGPKLKLAFDSG
jgi:hypothetical protein